MVLDHNNPLVVPLPYTFNSPSDYPTEVLANRFQAWRTIIKDLLSYFREFASVQEEIVRQQLRLQQAVKISSLVDGGTQNHHTSGSAKEDNAINKFFLPVGNGSIQDLPAILTKFHQQNITNASKTLKDINQTIIPKLDELRKDLLVKIKEIKNLQNDFHTNLGKEVNETKHVLNQFSRAIDHSNKLDSSSSSQHENDDPYIVKIKLDRQLRRQLNEENYLYEAYANLQNAGGKLESIIVLEIQNYISIFLSLVETESLTIPNFLVPNVNHGFLSKESTFEWDAFISNHLPTSMPISAQNKGGTFIDLSFPARKVHNLNIPGIDSPLNFAVREGTLERRSKFLKSYSSGWYVLTCNYLHEFKSSDMKKDPHPVMSLPLDSCTVTEHSKDDGKQGGVYKFILCSKGSNGLMHRSHNWVFRTDNYDKMINWYNDLKTLTSLPTPSSRARFLKKSSKVQGNVISSSKKISRNSSLTSNITNSKSLKTLATNNSGHGNRLESLRSRPTSQNTSPGNLNRLSSTFSTRDNQSTRLGNMINSDGTIITPVDTRQDDEQFNGQNGVTKVESKTSETGKGTPQALGNLFHPSIYPQNYIVATPSQGQQFYDPVLQQFYMLTPSAPPQAQVASNMTPRPDSPQHFYSVAPTQSPAQQQPLYQMDPNGYYLQYHPLSESFKGDLPYPTGSHIPTDHSIISSQRASSPTNESVVNKEIKDTSKNNKTSEDDSTLKSLVTGEDAEKREIPEETQEKDSAVQ